MNASPQAPNEAEDWIDLSAYLKNLKRYWYWGMMFIAGGVFVAFLVMRYTTPLFQLHASLIVEESSDQSLSLDKVLGEEILANSSPEIQNEIERLKSYETVNNALEGIKGEVAYFTQGHIRDLHFYYKDYPYHVTLTQQHAQISEVPFFIEEVGPDRYLLQVSASSFRPYYPDLEQREGSRVEEFSFRDTCRFGEVVKTDYFSLMVTRNPNHSLEMEKYSDQEFYFVVKDLKLLTQEYQKKLGVSQTGEESTVLQLSLQTPLHERGQDFLDTLASYYIHQDLAQKNRKASNTIQFIDDQLDVISDSLAQAESRLARFRERNRFLKLEQEATKHFEELKDLEKQQADLRLRAKYFNYLKDYLASKQDTLEDVMAPSAIGIDDPALNQLLTRLSETHAKLEGISIAARKDNPVYQNLRSQLMTLRQSLRENVQGLVRNNRTARREVEQQIRELESQVATLPEKERKLIRIKRKFSLNESVYNMLMERRAEAAIVKAGNTPDIRVLNAPRSLGYSPVFPDGKLVYAVGFGGGVFLFLSGVLLLTLMDNRLRTIQDLGQLTSYPLLGEILSHKKGGHLPIIDMPRSAFSESVRALGTKLRFLQVQQTKCPVVGVSSAGSQEGKTFLTMNMAIAKAQAGRRILVIDADLHKGSLSKYLALDTSQGFSQFLMGRCNTEEALQSVQGVENLDAISSGDLPPVPSNLLHEEKISELLSYLRSSYDFILIDSAPIGLVTDYLAYGHLVDINLLVTRSRITPRRALQAILAQVDQQQLRNVVFVLNDVRRSEFFYNRYGASGYYAYH